MCAMQLQRDSIIIKIKIHYCLKTITAIMVL